MDGVEILGLVAGFGTSVSSLPQLIKIWKQKEADHVSIVMLFVLIVAGGLWIIYGILKPDFPILATNSVAVVINIITTVLRIKYSGVKEKKE